MGCGTFPVGWYLLPARGRIKIKATSLSIDRGTRSLSRKPHPAKPGSVFPRLQPKASRSLPSWTETQVSVTPSYLASACLRVPKAGRSPLGKRPRRAARSRVTRSRHKRPPPPSTLALAGSPHIYSVSPLRALDRPAWFAVVAGFDTGPLLKKIMGHEFFLSADLSKTRSFTRMYLIGNMFHVEQ